MLGILAVFRTAWIGGVGVWGVFFWNFEYRWDGFAGIGECVLVLCVGSSGLDFSFGLFFFLRAFSVYVLVCSM